MAYPGIYRAKAASINGTRLQAFIPQVFGDVPVTVENFIGDLPTSTTMGWVSFQGGNPEFPVWHGAGVGGGGGGGTGTVTDVMWVGPEAPTAPDIELWWDTDEPPQGGGGEEVYIGAEPPGAGYELWYDTDAEAPLTIEQRWNTAWGVIAEVADNDTVAGIFAQADVGVSLQFTTVAGRRYRLFASAAVSQQTALGVARLIPHVDGVAGANRAITLAATSTGSLDAEYVFTPTAGTHTASLQMLTSAGTCTLRPAGSTATVLLIEDVGPITQGTTPPQPTGVLTVWNPTITGLTKGSGIQKAWYLKYGNVCNLTYEFDLRTGSAITGSVTLSLPFPALTWGTMGTGAIYQGQESRPIQAQPWNDLNSATLLVYGYADLESNFLVFSPTVPWTWGSTGFISFSMQYLTEA